MPERATSLEHRLLEQDSIYNQSLCNTDSTQFELTQVDKLIDKVGGQHTYQFRSLLIFNMVWFLTSWILMGQGFFFDNQYTCNDIEDPTVCSKYICSLQPNERIFAIKTHPNSIAFAFPNELFICENEDIISILQSLLYAGSVLGLLIIPYISDNWGRTKAIRSSWGLFIFGILFICISESSTMIGIGQFLCGFGCNPAITICYSFLNQQILRSKRQRYCIIIQVFLAIGQCTIAFLFIPKYDWKTTFYILLGLVLITCISLSYLLQSPKFLMMKSKDQALVVLNKIAQINKKQPIQQKQIDDIKLDATQFKRSSIYDLFKYRSLKWATLSIGFIFLAVHVVYFGTFLNLLNVGYNKLISQQIVGVSEGLGYIFTELIITRVTRKKFSMITLGLTTIFCFILALCINFQQQVDVQTLNNIETVGLIITRCTLCIFMSFFYVYISEIYPTKIRTIAIGWISIMGLSGGILTPYIVHYLNKWKINAWIVPGFFGLTGFLSIFFLKETYGKPMYDEISQIRIITKLQALQAFKDQINTIQSSIQDSILV